MNDEYQNQDVNNQGGNPENITPNNNQEDTTYHRSYVGEDNPNMRTYVNETTQPTYNNPNMNQQGGNASYNQQANNQQANQRPGFYANYDPNGGGVNHTYYQNSTTSSQAGNFNQYNGQFNNVKPAKVKKEKKPHPVLKFIGKAVAFGLIAGVIIVSMMFIGFKFNKNDNVATTKNTETTKSDTGTVKTAKGNGDASSGSVADIVENDMPSIVSITSTFDASRGNNFSDFYYWFYGGNSNGNSEQVGSGSGVIISETDDELMIVTNNHVISDSAYGDATKVQVTFSDDKIVNATVKGTDSDADLAVLTVKKSDMESSTRDKVKIAVIGDSDDLKVGDQVVAIGNALGYGQSVTTGIVSALEREVQLEDKSMTLLQTDAAINPGNSGGALLNMNGELVGINSVKYASSEVEGMGYAIPMATAQPIIEDLMNYEEVSEKDAAYLGIYGSNVSKELTSNYDMPEGVWVTKITKNSPAAKAGIQQRDIITKFNDRKITSMKSLQAQIAKKKAGTEVTVTVMRQGQDGEYEEKEFKVTLGKKSEAPTINSSDDNRNSKQVPETPDEDEGQNQAPNQEQDPFGDEMDPFEYFFGN